MRVDVLVFTSEKLERREFAEDLIGMSPIMVFEYLYSAVVECVID